MSTSRRYMILLLLLCQIFLSFELNHKAGIKIAIGNKVLDIAKKKVVDTIAPHLQHLFLKEKQFGRAKITNLTAGFNLTDNNMIIDWQEPNYLNLTLKRLASNVKLHVFVNLPVLKDIDTDAECNFEIKSLSYDLSIDQDFVFISGLDYRNITVIRVWPNRTQDTYLHCSKPSLPFGIMGKIEKKLIQVFHEIVDKVIKEKVLEEVNKFLKVNAFLTMGNYFIDLTAADRTGIVSNSFVMNMWGDFNCWGHPWGQDRRKLLDIPDYDPTGKMIQINIGSHTFDDMLRRLSSDGVLNGTITPENLPPAAKLLISLDTESLDEFFPGLLQEYHENLPCEIALDFRHSQEDKVLFRREFMELDAHFLLELFVRKSDTVKERALGVELDFTFMINMQIKENVEITLEVENIYWENAVFFKPTFQIEPKEFLKILNDKSQRIKKLLNIAIKALIKIKLPKIKQIIPKDSTFTQEDDYVSLNLNLEYSREENNLNIIE